MQRKLLYFLSVTLTPLIIISAAAWAWSNNSYSVNNSTIPQANRGSQGLSPLVAATNNQSEDTTTPEPATSMFYNANINNPYFLAPGSTKLQELSGQLKISEDRAGNNIDAICLTVKNAYDGYNKGERLGLKWRLMPGRYQGNGEYLNYNIEQIISAHSKGICQDWAKLTASIFLSKGIASVIVEGSKSDENGQSGDKLYHSWCEIYYKGQYFITENGEFRRKGQPGLSDSFSQERKLYHPDSAGFNQGKTYQYDPDWFHQYPDIFNNLQLASSVN